MRVGELRDPRPRNKFCPRSHLDPGAISARGTPPPEWCGRVFVFCGLGLMVTFEDQEAGGEQNEE